MTPEELYGYHEIQRELVAFARGMDERDWDALADILVEDAVVDVGEGVLHGRAAFIATLRRYLDACGPTQHLLGNLIVDVDREEARSRCYVSDMHLGREDRAHLTFATLGDYHDRWRKIDGRWRMIERVKQNHGHVGSLEVFRSSSTVTG